MKFKNRVFFDLLSLIAIALVCVYGFGEDPVAVVKEMGVVVIALISIGVLGGLGLLYLLQRSLNKKSKPVDMNQDN